MNKLFVVFSRTLSQPARVLKTKSYAKGLIKKNSQLEIKQFGNQIDVETFIKELEKINEIEENIERDKKTLKQFQDEIENYNSNNWNEQLESNDGEKEMLKSQQKSFKLQQKQQEIGGKQKCTVQKIELMRQFEASEMFQSLSTIPTININSCQNQNHELTPINSYIQNQSIPSTSQEIGQKFKHQAQFIGTLQALTDLEPNNHKKVNIDRSNDYVLKSLETKRTSDEKLDPILLEFSRILLLLDSISKNKINDFKFPEKLIFYKEY